MAVRPGLRGRRAGRQRRRQIDEELILGAAEVVFAERGFDAAKVQEIADEAGFALGTLYKHFKGKAQIFSRIHERRSEALFAACEEALENADNTLAALLGFTTAYLHELVAHPHYLRMHLGDASAWGFGDRFANRVQARAWQRGHEVERRLFEEGIDQGIFLARDPSLLVRMMAATQQVQLAHWLEGGMQTDPARLIEEMRVDLVRFFCRSEVAAWLAAAPSDPTPGTGGEACGIRVTWP